MELKSRALAFLALKVYSTRIEFSLWHILLRLIVMVPSDNFDLPLMVVVDRRSFLFVRMMVCLRAVVNDPNKRVKLYHIWKGKGL